MTSPDDRDDPTPSPLFLRPSSRTGAATGAPLRSLSSETDPSPTPSPDPDPTPPWSDPHDAYDVRDSAGDSSSAAPSTDEPKSRRGKRLAALRKPFRAAVVTAGGIVDQFLSRPGEAGVWLPDDDDVKGIADPLASIASRRAPSGVDNPDVTDGLAAAAAFLSYVVKSLAARSQVALQRQETYDPAAGADLLDVGPGPEPSAPAQPDDDAPATAGLSWLRRRAGLGPASDDDQPDAGEPYAAAADGRGSE